MKIAVIGANSFCGRAYCALLEKQGYECGRFTSRNFDLRTQGDALGRFIVDRQYTHIVNFAALNIVEQSWEEASDYYQVNVVGLADLATALVRREWMGRFIHMTTPEVYGSHDETIHPDTPFNPSTPYAVSRAAGDQHLLLQHRVHGLDVVLVRTCNVYGPGQEQHRVIPHTILSLLKRQRVRMEGDGSSIRAFLHIENAVRAWDKIRVSGLGGRTYFVSSGEIITIKNLIHAICLLMGRDFESAVEHVADRTNKDHAYVFISTTLDWRSSITLTEGLERTIAWYREHLSDYTGGTK